MPCYLVILIPVNRQKKCSQSSRLNSKDKKIKNYAVVQITLRAKYIVKRWRLIVIYEERERKIKRK